MIAPHLPPVYRLVVVADGASSFGTRLSAIRNVKWVMKGGKVVVDER